MRLEVNGVTVDTVELVTLEVLHTGGVESKYGQDYDYQYKPRNRHAIGMKRCRFTIRKWYKADSSNTDLFYTLFDNDTEFTLKEYLAGLTGFAGLTITGCEIYNYTPTTGAANDIIQEEIIGEGTLWKRSDWLDGWDVRRCHDINSAVGAGTDYQVKITVYYGAGVSSGGDVYCNSKCKTDFGDIRFTSSDGRTELDYWIESKTDSVSAIFWVEVKDSLDSNVTIYIYYGNASATTTSNFDDTFVFGETWDDATLDTNRWTSVDGNPTYTIDTVNHVLEITNMDDNWFNGKGFHSKNIVFPDSYIVEAARITDILERGVGVSMGGSPYNGIFGVIFLIAHTSWDSTDLGIAFESVVDYWYQTDAFVVGLGVGGNTDWSFTEYIAGNHIYFVTIIKLASTGKIQVWKHRQATAVDLLYVNETNSEVPNTVHIGINKYSGYLFGDQQIHDFKIRKYVSPEPTHSSWCEEATS